MLQLGDAFKIEQSHMQTQINEFKTSQNKMHIVAQMLTEQLSDCQQ